MKTSVVVVFICNEENSTITDISIDRLEKEGYLSVLKNGPVFWIDSADSQPCIGTAGGVQWELNVTGKAFHSGLPHLGINAVEFAMDVVTHVQQRFYADFPPHPEEVTYNFMTSSTMKPTQIESAVSSAHYY